MCWDIARHCRPQLATHMAYGIELCLSPSLSFSLCVSVSVSVAGSGSGCVSVPVCVCARARVCVCVTWLVPQGFLMLLRRVVAVPVSTSAHKKQPSPQAAAHADALVRTTFQVDVDETITSENNMELCLKVTRHTLKVLERLRATQQQEGGAETTTMTHLAIPWGGVGQTSRETQVL